MIPADQPERRSELRIGRYAVIGRIGRGGMGMVYRGYDETLDREIAIKTLTVEGSGDEESRARFGIEARAAARLQHPNIVTVYELGQDRGVSFIAMELLPGIDLESLLRSEEALLLQEKLEIVIQVCRGLAFAHEKGVVHRDIKPANIRLLDDGTVKIMDFGIAKQIDTTGVTRDQMMIGTLSYMSPEQIQGRKLDGRSDVFSVGVLLYQLLAGERPFPGPGSQVLYQICHQAAPELGVDLGSAGPRLEDLVSRALAKDPEERVKGASRLGDELAQVLDWYSRSVVPPVPDEDQQLLADARRRIRDEPVDETLELYASLVDRNPHSVEARRALRAANRQALEAEKPPPVDDAYPELEATFRAGGTAGELPFHQATQTLMQPPTVMRGPASSSGKLVAGLVVVGALALGAALLMRNGPPPIAEPTPRPVPPAVSEGAGTPAAGAGEGPGAETADSAAGSEPAASRGTGGAAAADAGGRSGEATASPLRVSVVSDPPGASVVLDGRPAGGVTPLELSLARGSDHSVALSLEGHQGKTLELRAGEVPQRIAVSLEALRPPGTLVVRSSYPIEIVWGGRVLASGESTPQVQLPAGSHTVTLRSQAHFLDVRREVEIQAGQQSQLATPPLGRIHIRATPGNCRIFIDGAFADYPPISNQPIAAGRHRVEFRWPDGKTKEQSVEVESGESAYVTERR